MLHVSFLKIKISHKILTKKIKRTKKKTQIKANFYPKHKTYSQTLASLPYDDVASYLTGANKILNTKHSSEKHWPQASLPHDSAASPLPLSFLTLRSLTPNQNCCTTHHHTSRHRNFCNFSRLTSPHNLP